MSSTSQAKLPLSSHLKELEDEAIYVLREVAAEFRNPVLLYSIGKDSSVLLHLALKAFHPAKPPFPLLHVDTKWKFREMIAFRDATVQELGAPRSAFSPSEAADTSGTRASSVRNCGDSSIPASRRTSRCASSRCRIGPRSMFGGTS
jgi:3'-phosphoadenosine 5'-phosphosulfate sulfotransferase (PAPS reductase)/FAD synthetase